VRTIGERLHVLRDLVVDVYGADNRAAASFMQAVENVKHLQHVLAKPLEDPPVAPPPERTGIGILALSCLVDSIGDSDDSVVDERDSEEA
jgi:hypothetical protein